MKEHSIDIHVEIGGAVEILIENSHEEKLTLTVDNISMLKDLSKDVKAFLKTLQEIMKDA